MSREKLVQSTTKGEQLLISVPKYITVVQENEMARACSTHADNRNVYRILVGKPEGKRPLKRPRRR
jgi:hypothetical protein